MNTYLIGVSLGVLMQRTAIIILDCVRGEKDRTVYNVVWTKRFDVNASYRDILGILKEKWDYFRQKGIERELVVDCTGTASLVSKRLQECGIFISMAYSIVNGSEEIIDGDKWGRKKKVGVEALRQNLGVVFKDEKRLSFAPGLSDIEIIARQTTPFCGRRTKSGNDAVRAEDYVREQADDDYMLALAVAVYYGENRPPTPRCRVIW